MAAPGPPARRRATAAASLALGAALLAGWPAAFAAGKRVVVTGAGGQTGKLVVQKLVSTGRFDVRPLVHSEKSKAKLLSTLDGMLPDSKVIVGDITSKETIQKAFVGAVAVVVVTSAVPVLKTWSLIPFMLAKLFRRKGRLRFSWKNNGKPEQVDWEGQKNQFDLCKEAGVKHVVLVGTMTGTDPEGFLNTMGDGDGDKIVMWKRKAEMYLIDICKDSDMDFTIVHAGGLSNDAGGVTRVAVGVDDKLRERTPRRLPRADLAEVCLQALDCQAARNVSFDVSGSDDGVTLESDSLDSLLQSLGGASCDYSINPPP
ncbi:unnamed protein product [Prorocentrum cordatum]|uniref:NAD(P)-binding domain-containing protein n=1 Tax=Prorocentrum cordatum TaxID=2364126 RepID=A0ABN9SLG3_9DINO|nr:unnamed protein product [Polarella glacialis]